LAKRSRFKANLKLAMSTPEIDAPAAWRSVDFISDLHLQSSEQANVSAWMTYLDASPADAIFILGDLFEVWIGDDVLKADGLNFEQQCCLALQNCAKQRKLFFMHGNRDFLIGQAFAQQSAMTILSDPSVLLFGGQRYLLSHGDALCLADTDYQKFRETVRSNAWQTQFLATPLEQRKAQARQIRMASELRKKEHHAAGQPWVDIDASMARQWMDAARAQHFIHGHTHEGRDHAIQSAQGEGVRHVLPDWHAGEQSASGYALRLTKIEHGVLAQQISVV
jgi:UDP-2,3-diacylglucosamine hydrolase